MYYLQAGLIWTKWISIALLASVCGHLGPWKVSSDLDFGLGVPVTLSTSLMQIY
jgi:hypothetical protein